MDADAIAAMLAEDRAEWEALAAVLDAHPEGALHDPESPDWTSRDVYAHLARWIEHSTNALESWVATRTLPPPSDAMKGNDDEINARWQAEDSNLSLKDARARAYAQFERRIKVIESVPADRWDQIAEATAKADDAKHYRNHRRYIEEGLAAERKEAQA
jgi:hypothetical protein